MCNRNLLALGLAIKIVIGIYTPGGGGGGELSGLTTKISFHSPFNTARVTLLSDS